MGVSDKEAFEALVAIVNYAKQKREESGIYDSVTLVRKGSGVRLFGKSGPIGELLCVNSAGESVVRFKASSVVRAGTKMLKAIENAIKNATTDAGKKGNPQ